MNNVQLLLQEMCGNGLQHSRSLPFPSVRSHSQSHSHDAYDLIPIPVPLPNFLPIPSHSRTNDIYHWIIKRWYQLNFMVACHKEQTLQYFIGLHSHRVNQWEFWHTWKSSHSHRHVYSSHSHSHFWHICVPIPMGIPRESHENGNPIPMHISSVKISRETSSFEFDLVLCRDEAA